MREREVSRGEEERGAGERKGRREEGRRGEREGEEGIWNGRGGEGRVQEEREEEGKGRGKRRGGEERRNGRKRRGRGGEGRGKEERSLHGLKHKIKKMKEHSTEWKKRLENPLFAKSPGGRIYKDKTIKPAYKWPELQMCILQDRQVLRAHRRHPAPSIIRDWQIKTTWRCRQDQPG